MSDHNAILRTEYDNDLGNFYGWRTMLLGPLFDQFSDISDKDILLFGVFGGKTTIEMCQLLTLRNLAPKTIWCFDSFQGIPAELAEPVVDLWHPQRSHFFHAFNAQEFFESDDVEGTVVKFLNRIAPYKPDCVLSMVPGFFDQTLTDEFAQRIQNPLAIIIDVDIYSSTKTIHDWLIRNNLMVPGQTLIGYDDWTSPGFETMSDGESRAHREMVEQTGFEFEYLGGHESRLFRYIG